MSSHRKTARPNGQVEFDGIQVGKGSSAIHIEVEVLLKVHAKVNLGNESRNSLGHLANIILEGQCVEGVMYSFANNEHGVDNNGVRGDLSILGKSHQDRFVDVHLSLANKQVKQRDKVLHSKDLSKVVVLCQYFLHHRVELRLNLFINLIVFHGSEDVTQQHIHFTLLAVLKNVFNVDISHLHVLQLVFHLGHKFPDIVENA
mmetsp:Transcript_29295/g.41244  ORF Transcript_29295/g.41244 Transcript_29295/m.41244 type:complete len:202 (-) Transcript_29295:1585-2190(-)